MWQALLIVLIAAGFGWQVDAATQDDAVVERVRRILDEVRTVSYPELSDVVIEIRLFDSPSDYFQTRFSFTDFLFRKQLRCQLSVNRKLVTNGAPEEGMRAIIAHELGHVVYYRTGNRLRLLGLLRLAGGGFTARFERATDIEAIARGYGEGLKAYRTWLYLHVPAKKLAEKKCNYFSPDEIDALQAKLRAHPELLDRWRKAPPLSLKEIELTSARPDQLQTLWPAFIFSLR